MPTERHGVAPDWTIEHPLYFGPDSGPARIVHRGTCHAARERTHPATAGQARTTLTRPDVAPCPICHPDPPPARRGTESAGPAAGLTQQAPVG